MKNTVKILIIALSGCLAVANAVSILDLSEWFVYKMQHAKRYGNFAEDSRRMRIYLEHKNRIAEHNQQYDRGLVSYRMGLNAYSDLSQQEFTNHMNGLKRPSKVNSNSTVYYEGTSDDLPNSIDWRSKGAVTEVKDQGHCGSCWSFSTTGALEGQNFIKTGKLVSLSEQNLIDCSTPYGNKGCNGGWMDQAFEYVKENGGIDTEQSYPYRGANGECQYSKEDSGASDNGYVDIPENDEQKLQEAIASIGPISVAIDASHDSFRHYESGIYDEPECSPDQLDHGVLAVGYGTDENGNDYYIVKNSWGTTWGENGYIRIARNGKNMCGIATASSYPIV